MNWTNVFENSHNPKGRQYLFFIVTIILLILTTIWFLLGQYLLPLKKVSFSQEYIDQNQGQVSVVVLEVYELANIIIAITDYGINDPFRVYKEGDYYKEVIDHFSPFRDHPLISKLNLSDARFDLYFRFRENSFAYRFEGNQIIPHETYKIVQIPNWFEKYREDVEDFAQESEFPQFYEDHEDFYLEQAGTYFERVPVRMMWDWLEAQFPQVISSYKVVFSPLIGASSTTTKY